MNEILSLKNENGEIVLSINVSNLSDAIVKDGFVLSICDEDDYSIEITPNGRVLPKIKYKVIN